MRKYVHDLVEISMFTALAIVLDRFVKIPIGLNGGSLNIAVLPLAIIALRHGPLASFIASGILYSCITCILDAWGFEWFLLDYFVSFGSIFILGFISKFINKNYQNKKIFSHLFLSLFFVLFIIIRLLATSLDGAIFYNMSYLASLSYNVIYIIPSGLLVLVLLNAMLPLIIRINKSYKTSYLN